MKLSRRMLPPCSGAPAKRPPKAPDRADFWCGYTRAASPPTLAKNARMGHPASFRLQPVVKLHPRKAAPKGALMTRRLRHA